MNITEKYFFKKLDNTFVHSLQIENQKNNEIAILFVNGHNSNIGRSLNICRYFAGYATVFTLDLPGFGQSSPLADLSINGFLKTIDLYIENIIPKNKKIIIVGFSLGFSLTLDYFNSNFKNISRVVGLVSLSGLVSKYSLRFYKKFPYFAYIFLSKLILIFPFTRLFQAVINSKILDYFIDKYTSSYSYNSDEEREISKQIRINLWRKNDVRTHFFTFLYILRFNILPKKKIEVPTFAFLPEVDNYFKEEVILDFFSKYFVNCEINKISTKNHTPKNTASVEEISNYFGNKVFDFFERINMNFK